MAGPVAAPGEPGYDDGRAVRDASVDRRPAAVVGCASEEDVAAALDHAAAAGLPVTVRGAGTTAGAVADGALLLDLRALRSVEAHPEARRASVGGGATWGEVDAATQEHGLAACGARVSGLGAAGVILGGGSGWLERVLGPPAAALEDARVVTATGEVLAARDDGDVLWALRGGGGGLGVVTRLELGLHPVGPVLPSGFLAFPRSRAGAVLGPARDVLEGAPDVGGGLTLFAGRGGACEVAYCRLEAPAEPDAALTALRALDPSLDAVGPNPYVALQTMLDLRTPFGMRVQRITGSLRGLPDAALDALIEAADRPAAALCRVHLWPRGGALDRFDPDGGALREPSAPWAFEALGLWPPVPALDAGNLAWVEGVRDALAPWTRAAEPDRARDARLGEVRHRCDPAGLLRQTISPPADARRRRSRSRRGPGP